MLKEAWRGLVDFVQEINTTSSRILASIVLATIIVLSTLVMMVFKIAINEAVLGILCTFVVSMGGLDVIQFTQKRKSFVPDATVSGPDISATVSNRVIGEEHGVEFTE